MKSLIKLCLLALVLSSCSQGDLGLKQPLTAQDFGTASADYASAVTANATGVFVVGYTYGSLEAPNKGLEDAFIRHYNGGVVWAQQFGTRSYDRAEDVAVDSSGNTYIFGRTVGSLGFKIGEADCFLRKYNSAGVLQWTRQFGSSTYDYNVDLRADSSGNYYTVSQEANFTKNVIRKWNNNGAVVFSKTILDSDLLLGYPIKALGVDSTGNIYMLTQVSNAIKLYKYSSTGATVAGFPKTIYNSANSDIAYDMVIDTSNNIYVTFREDIATKGAYLRKLDSNGLTLWTKRLEPTNITGYTEPKTLALDSTGNIYVGGNTTGAYTGFDNTDGGFYDIFALKYNPTGTRLWTQQFGAGIDDFGHGIAVSDTVYLVGYSNSSPNLVGDPSYGNWDAYLAQLDKTTGDVLGIDQ